MQKFTRALKREIELGGERIGLSIDDQGITMRLVGYRRPPTSLTWAQILCFATGRPLCGTSISAQELAAAIGVLQSNAVSATNEKSHGTLEKLLDRLDCWLKKSRTRFHDGLLPGATDGEIAKLEKDIGRPVPNELRQWLNWHNGQDEEVIGALIESFNILSSEEIAEAWQERQEDHDKTWDPTWIPLLDDFQGNLIVLDPKNPGCAVREVWRGNQDHPVVAPTLEAWLSAFVGDVEAGRYEEDPERGEFHRLEK